MRKIRFIFIILVFLFYFPICMAENLTNKECSHDFLLQTSLKDCAVKSTIILKSGLYKGNFNIYMDLNLVSLQNATITSSGVGKILYIAFPGSIVKGVYFKISGKDVTLKDSCVFIGKYANLTQLKDNKFFECGFSIWVHNSNCNYIVGNRIIGTLNFVTSIRGNSIHIFSSKGTLIEDNYIKFGRDGVYISTSKEVIIKNNIFNNTRYGIHYMYSNSCSIVNNKIKHSSAGAAIMYSKFVDIINNFVMESKEHGLLVRDVLHSTILNNKTFKNYEGVYFGGSYYNKILENDIIRNFIAVKVSNGTNENIFYKNNFIDNKIQVQLIDNKIFIWSFGSEGNYWSHFIGPAHKTLYGVGNKKFYVTTISDWLTGVYPNTKMIFNSPVMGLLEKIENQFPAIRKSAIIDNFPLLRPYYA